MKLQHKNTRLKIWTIKWQNPASVENLSTDPNPDRSGSNILRVAHVNWKWPRCVRCKMKSKNLHLYIRYLSDSDLSKSQLKIVLLRTCNNCYRLPRKSRCEDKVIKTTCVALIHESRSAAKISHFIPTSFHYQHNYSLLVPTSTRLTCEKCFK